MSSKRVYTCSVIALIMVTTAVAQKLTLPGGDAVLPQKQRIAAARRAGDYLIGIIQEDGRFIYEYSPKTGKPSESYNWLRHCGTVMSLCQLYQVTKDERYLDAAEKTIPVFVSRIKEVQIGDKKYTALISETGGEGGSKETVKTGGCALAAIALMTYDSCRGTQQYKKQVLGLCEYIRQTQTKSGLLKSKFVIHKTPAESYYSDFQSMFYQGEALLALAMVQDPGRYPTKENQECMLRLLNYLAYEWKAALQSPQKVIFDHWGMIGLSRAYGLINDEDMKRLQAEYLKVKTDSVDSLQKKLKTDLTPFDRVVLGRKLVADEAIRSVVAAGPMTSSALLQLGFDFCENELLSLIRSNTNNYRGSFTSSPGRVCPAATRIEGISAFGGLILSIPESKFTPRVKEWMERVDLSRRFMIKCQYTEADQKRFKGEVSIKGGLRDHLDWKLRGRDAIRIDYCQHTISALLGW